MDTAADRLRPLRRITATDFDGTLVRCDSLWKFLRHVEPRAWAYLYKVARVAPWLICAAVNRRLRAKAKERLLGSFLNRIPAATIEGRCQTFASVVDRWLNGPVAKRLADAKACGDEVAIVSASPAMWIEPWAKSRGYITVASRVDYVADGKGRPRLRLENCNDDDKVSRFLTRFPERQTYRIVYYGDSLRHDGPMMRLADEAFWVQGDKIEPRSAVELS